MINWDKLHPWKLRKKFQDEHEARVAKGRTMTPGHWFHFTDTGSHMDLVVKAALELSRNYPLHTELPLNSNTLLLSAICHDWGKTDDDIWNPDGPPWFSGHEKRSAELMVGLGLPEDDPAVSLVKLHGRTQQIDKFGDKAVRKLLDELGSARNQWTFFCLLICDCCGFSKEGRDAGLEQAKLFLEKSDVFDTHENVPLNVGSVAYQVTRAVHDFWTRA